MDHKKTSVAAVLLSLSLLLTSCGAGGNTGSGTQASTPDGTQSATSANVVSLTLPTEPVSADVEIQGTLITLNGTSAQSEGDGVTVAEGVVTITSAGTYTITGQLTGQLRVDVSEEEKVTLLLNGVSIQSPNSAALYVLSCPKKVVVSLAAGSVNLLSDGETYDESICDPSDGDVPDAALYSRDDLKFSGSGELYVVSYAHRGIHGKDDVEIEGSTLSVSAADDGILGKDSVSVTGGTVVIAAGGNGIRSSGTDTDAATGIITIAGGDISVTSDGDAIDANATLTVSGGTIAALVGGGYENGEAHSDDNFGGGGFGGGMGGGGRPGRMSTDTGSLETATLATTSTSTDVSHKGLKAGQTITVTGGTISVNASDDAVHCDGSIAISGGSFYLQSGDDGIHAENELNLSGGVLEVAISYEGLEGDIIRISNGTIRVTASDDGVNAGTSTTGMGGFGGGFGGGGMGGFGGSGSSEPTDNGLFITGGYLVINADGDGLDSNADITMDGGMAIVYGPESNGNGALDYGEGCTFHFVRGTLLAMGSSGMAEDVTLEGDGGQLAFTMNGSANTLLTINDENSERVLCVESPKTYSCVVFASDTLLKAGNTYTVSVGGTCDGTALDGLYKGGTCSGGETLGSLQAN